MEYRVDEKIYGSLPQLDTTARYIAILSVFATLGNNKTKLEETLCQALEAGCSAACLKELFLQLLAYVGFPRAINALDILQEVLVQKYGENMPLMPATPATEAPKRAALGSQELALVNQVQEAFLRQKYQSFSPELVDFIIDFAYGDLYGRPYLGKIYREVGIIASIVTLGHSFGQLEFHISAGLVLNLSPAAVKEIIAIAAKESSLANGELGLQVLAKITG